MKITHCVCGAELKADDLQKPEGKFYGLEINKGDKDQWFFVHFHGELCIWMTNGEGIFRSSLKEN